MSQPGCCCCRNYVPRRQQARGHAGLRPDGIERAPKPSSENIAPPPADNSNDFTLAEAVRAPPAFYIVAAGLFTLSMLVTTLHFFQVSIFADAGLERRRQRPASPSRRSPWRRRCAAGRPPARPHADRVYVHRRPPCAGRHSLAGAINGLAAALVYAVVFGLANAVGAEHCTFMWPRYFGRSHLGSIQGVGQTIGVVGASLTTRYLSGSRGTYTKAMIPCSLQPRRYPGNGRGYGGVAESAHRQPGQVTTEFGSCA